MGAQKGKVKKDPNGLKLAVPFDYLFKIFTNGTTGVIDFVETEEACGLAERKGGKGKNKKGANKKKKGGKTNKKKGKKPKPCPTFNDTLESLTETSSFASCMVYKLGWNQDLYGYNNSVRNIFQMDYGSIIEYVWSEAEPCINSGGKLPLTSRCQDNFNEQELWGLQYLVDVAAN